MATVNGRAFRESPNNIRTQGRSGTIHVKQTELSTPLAALVSESPLKYEPTAPQMKGNQHN
jgi:hypothetical protein